MKSNRLFMPVVFIFAALLLTSALCAESVDDILAKVDKLSHTNSSKIYLTQTVTSPSGQKRTFKMVSYSKDGNDKGLTEYLAPRQVKGMKILTLNDGDDIWSYFPRTNRTRKIASSARNRKVQGSDFTYDDMASGKMKNSWKGRLAGDEKIDGKICFKMVLTPKAKGPKSYSKATAWISKADYTTIKIEYYDLDGDKLKMLKIDDYKKINGVLIPHKYTMTNLMDGGKTTMTVAKAYVNINLDTSIFTESSLGK